MNEPRDPMREQDRIQAVVIRHVIDAHPVPLTRADLSRELSYDKIETDDLEIAVRELGRLGLLEEEGKRLRPSRSAVRYDELSEQMG